MNRVNGVGVAFCGGGFRSYAEVAALEDMERNGVKIGAVAGTSMGAAIAALVGGGLNAAQVEQTLVDIDNHVVEQGYLSHIGLKLLGMVNGNGIINSNILQDVVREFYGRLGIVHFSDFKMPVALPAQDLISGDLCVFTNDPEFFADEYGMWTCISQPDMEVAPCIAASASYPLFLTPTSYLGRTYIDGCCRMNLPTPLFARNKVDAVVGVAMRRKFEPLKDVRPLPIMQRTVDYGADQLDRINASIADVFINLPVGGEAFGAGMSEQIIAEARRMMEENPVDWSSIQPDVLTAVKRAAKDVLARLARGA